MFPVTYGFSASFTVEFWIEKLEYKNPLMQLAITTVDDAFAELGWPHSSSVELKLVCGAGELIQESKLEQFCRYKLNPFLRPGMLSTMQMVHDSIHWTFEESESKVIANVAFYIRKTTFFNKPGQEKLSSIIKRLFEKVFQHSKKYSLGVAFKRNDRNA